MLVENMEDKSLKALRLTYDEVISSGEEIKSFLISPELSMSCKQANARYKKELAEKKALKEDHTQAQKRKLIQNEYADVKRRRCDEEEVIIDLELQISELISKAAAEKRSREMKMLIVQADSFRVKISAKKETIKVLEDAIKKLSGEIKGCS